MQFRKLAITTTAATLWLSVGAAADHVPGGIRSVPATHQVHEQQDAHWSTRWEKKARVPARTLLPIRIGLVQSNLAAGDRLLSVM